MGLSPSTSPSRQAAPPASATTEQKAGCASGSCGTNVNITPGGSVAKRPLTKEEQYMASRLAAGKAPKTKPLSAFELKIKAYYEQKAKKYEKPPLILQETIEDPIDNPAWKSAITVTLSPSYLWGPKETAFIKKRLGYQDSEIPQNCQMRMDIELATNKSRHSFSSSMFVGERKAVKYDDSILQTVTISPSAICLRPKTPLPRKGGVIAQIGDKFSLQLMDDGTCQVPKGMNPRYLDAQYMGDGKVVCQFR